MPGKTTGLTALETRKQLLLVESELNRVQLLNELRDFKNEMHQWQHHAREIGSLMVSAAKLAETFSDIGHAFSHNEGDEKEKSLWISKLLAGAKAGMSLWRLFRSDRRQT
jgi:hypothetical protein